MLALGCDAGERPAAVGSGSDKPLVIVTRSEITYEGRLARTAGLAVPAAAVPGEMERYVPRFVIDYDCARNTSGGTRQRNTRFDLAARTREVVEVEMRERDVVDSTPVVTKLTDDRVDAIHRATLVALVWPGHKAEDIHPDGTACVLAIRNPYGTQLQLFKSDTKEPDAASELVKLLRAD
jgi:hypothetical protein